MTRERSDPDMPAINAQCGKILEANDELPMDLISMSLALATARVSRAATGGDEAAAWDLAVSALQAGFAFDERGVAPDWTPE